jgi:hypothetical protein
MFPRATLPGVGQPSPLLGHAAGVSWDEVLLVMAPLVAIGGLMWLANRRAARLNGRDEDDHGEDERAG